MRSDPPSDDSSRAKLPRVLVFLECADPAEWCDRVRAAGFDPHHASTLDNARRLLSASDFDVIIIGDSSLPALDRLGRLLRRHKLTAQIVAVIPAGQDHDAMSIVRGGACDVITRDLETASLRERLVRAAERALEAREQARTLRRLRITCRRLAGALERSHEKYSELSREVADLAAQAEARIADAALAAEFRALLSQELDLESLLRTTLQYLLKKTGPTNAAIFLPDAQGDFSLGAYVNYDCERESANLLLEHVAASICPHLKNEAEIVRFEDGDELAAFLVEQASIIRGRDVIAFRSAHGSRTYAIMMLFRDRGDAFSRDLPATLDLLRPLLAAQLESVLRVHHRARPQWPREAAEDAAEGDDEFGFGLAA